MDQLIYTIHIEHGNAEIIRTMTGRWGFDRAALGDALEADVRAYCEEFFHRPLFAGDTTTLACPPDLAARVTRWQAADDLRNLMRAIGPGGS